MTIHYPVVTEVGNGVFAVNEYGYAVVYVIVGEKRALVIDTGTGCFRLRAAVRRLTFLPYDVVLTHGHAAQSGGMGQFETVYVHPGEYARAMGISRLDSTEFCLSVQNERERLWSDVLPMECMWGKNPAFTELYEGQMFDLGGRTVTTIRTSGHTYGSCSFIDDKSRIAFCGDACSEKLDITECCVTSALRGLYHLYASHGEFDRIFPAYTGHADVYEVRSLGDNVLNDCITACRGILLENVEILPVSGTGENSLAVARFHGIEIMFNRNKIYEEGEEPLPF